MLDSRRAGGTIMHTCYLMQLFVGIQLVPFWLKLVASHVCLKQPHAARWRASGQVGRAGWLLEMVRQLLAPVADTEALGGLRHDRQRGGQVPRQGRHAPDQLCCCSRLRRNAVQRVADFNSQELANLYSPPT